MTAGEGTSPAGPAAEPIGSSERDARPAAGVGRWDLGGVVVVALASLAVHRSTLLPGLGAWDTAEAQVIPAVLGTMHPTGFPAYVLLGWLATRLTPLGSPAFLMNLLSAVLVAVAAGALVLVLRRLRVPLPIAAAAGIGFALSPVPWGIATAADVHALHAALLALVVLALVRWGELVATRDAAPGSRSAARRADRALVLAAALTGVALANHGLTILLGPAIGAFVLARDARVLLRPRVVLAAVVAAIGVAALLYLQLPLRAGPFRAPLVYGHPETWAGFWEIVSARQFQADVGGLLGNLGPKWDALVALLDAQLGPLVVLLPAAVAVTAVRLPRYALLSGLATAVTCLFAASYANAAIERYYLGPIFFAWSWIAIVAGLVVERLLGTTDGADEAGEGGAAAPAVPGRAAGPGDGGPAARARLAGAGLLAVALLVPTATGFEARRADADRSGETWVAGWVDEVFRTMEPGAVVASWWSYSTPMWYAQLVEGRRTDLFVVDDRTLLDMGLERVEQVLDRYLGERPVYLIRVSDDEIARLAATYRIEPAGATGNLYRVTGRLEVQQ